MLLKLIHMWNMITQLQQEMENLPEEFISARYVWYSWLFIYYQPRIKHIIAEELPCTAPMALLRSSTHQQTFKANLKICIFLGFVSLMC